MGAAREGFKNSAPGPPRADVRRARSAPRIEPHAQAQYGAGGLTVWLKECSLRIAMMGAGGVGGYVGAGLVEGGADVHFVARGADLAAMRERGLAIEGGPEP